MVFGFALAWTLVRYDFPGRKLVDAIIDMPFALPTAVSGIALATIFSVNGWIGQYLEPRGIFVAYTPLGITVALTLIGMPFVVRTVQPALQEVQRDLEDAAETLGAGRFYVFRRIIVPTVLPALLTGFTLAFARAVGEYGSVIFIAGNKYMKTEITPLLIIFRPRGIRLRGRRRSRFRDAGDFVRDAAGHQPAAGLGPQTHDGEPLTWRALLTCRRRRELATRPGHANLRSMLVRWFLITVSASRSGRLLAGAAGACSPWHRNRAGPELLEFLRPKPRVPRYRLTQTTAAWWVPSSTPVFGITAACVSPSLYSAARAFTSDT
jgi:ABC-type molybdate transport system permease subunit